MIIIKTIDKFYKPIIIISITLILFTLISYFIEFEGSDNSKIKSIIYFFDLNQNSNGGMWISVLIWIICGLSFMMFGLNFRSKKNISKKDKIFFIVIGVLVFLISLEKIFKLHLLFEFRAINVLGLFSERLREDSPYYWVFLIIIPLFIYLAINLLVVYRKLILGIPATNKLRLITTILFISAVFSIPVTILLDISQGYYWYSGMKHTIFNSLESCVEIIGVVSFISSNKYIANYYSEDIEFATG